MDNSFFASSPGLPGQHGRRQLGWYISATLRKQFPNLTKQFILSLGIVLSRILDAYLLGGDGGLGSLSPGGGLPLAPLEDRLGDGGQLLVRHLAVVS